MKYTPDSSPEAPRREKPQQRRPMIGCLIAFFVVALLVGIALILWVTTTG